MGEGVASLQCLENTTAVGKSVTSFGIDWLDRHLSRQTRNVGPASLQLESRALHLQLLDFMSALVWLNSKFLARYF